MQSRIEGSPLVIVDDPLSQHGRRMAHVLQPGTTVLWIAPTLQLPDALLAAPSDVVALPLRVRGGHRGDRFTARLADALRGLRARGCLVFVARGTHPNPLAAVDVAIGVRRSGLHSTASEACVAAAERAWLRLCQPRMYAHG